MPALMKCPMCEAEMMALFAPVPIQRRGGTYQDDIDRIMIGAPYPLVPIMDCLGCGFWFHPTTCKDMMAWVQAVILGEGGK